MPLNIRLQSPYIVVTGTQSILGITWPEQKKYQVGSIYKINMGSDWRTGTLVMFATETAIPISQGGDDYFMINENEVYYYEEDV